MLKEFPPFNEENQGSKKLDKDELIEIVKNGAPIKWQNKMLCQIFDTKGKSMSEVLEFFNRLAQSEGKSVMYSVDKQHTIDERIPRKAKMTSDFEDHSGSFT